LAPVFALSNHSPVTFAGTTQKYTLLIWSRPTGLSGASSEKWASGFHSPMS
jgi:hypothetical protein